MRKTRLILTVKEGQSFLIGEEVEITVKDCHRRGRSAKILIDAPENIKIKRITQSSKKDTTENEAKKCSD